MKGPKDAPAARHFSQRPHHNPFAKPMKPRVYRSPFNSVIVAACGLGLVLIGLGGVADAEMGKVSRCMFGVILVLGMYQFIRACRASVRVNDRGVTSHGYLRTRRYPWEEIRSIALSHAAHILPWYLPVISPVNGKDRRCAELSSLVWRGSPAESQAGKAADEINRLLHSRDRPWRRGTGL